MIYFEHNFDDGTGIRLVDVPHEDIQREVVEVQFRVSVQGQKPRLAKCPLFDKDKMEDLFPAFVDSILKQKIREIGRKCKKCEDFYLPVSPSQKVCKACAEASGVSEGEGD